MSDRQVNVGGAPVQLGPAGFWLDADGNIAATDPSGAPQITPGMKANPGYAIYYDAQKDLNYTLNNGKKSYQAPVTYDNSGRPILKNSIHGSPISDKGGGMVHGNPTWNSETGQYDIPLDWGKIASIGTAGFLGGDVLGTFLGGVGGGVGAPVVTASGTPEVTLSSAPIAAGGTSGVVGAAAGGSAAGGTGGAMSFLDFLKSPSTLFDIGKTALSGIGSFLQGKADSKTQQMGLLAQLQEAQKQREDSQRAALASFLQNTMNLNQTQAQAGLSSTQMDPYYQAKALNAANVRRSFAGGLSGGPNSPFTGSFDMSALSPENLSKNADYFYKNVGAVSPNVPLTDVSPNADAFRQSYKSAQDQLAQQIMEYLKQIGAPLVNPVSLPKV